MTEPTKLAAAFACVTLCGLAACSSARTASPSIEAADLVFRGGAVYTVNDEQPWAEAVAIDEGRIVYVGSEAGIESFIGESTEVMEIGEGMLLPGFHDSHMHPMRAGNRFLRCQMEGLAWPDEILAELRRCEQKLRSGQWLRGVGLPDELFDSGQLNKSFLDEIAADHPAFITNRSGYLGWVNSAALTVAGIDSTTPDPTGGEIVRELGSDEPTGVLRLSAIGPVYMNIPEPDETDLREALRLASEMANAFGITSSNEAQLMPENWRAYVATDRAGELSLRVQGSQAWEFDRGLEQLKEIRQRRDTYQSPFFQANTIKLFLDGSLIFNHGAALLEPYTGTADNFGSLNVDNPEQVKEIVRAADALGINVHMHALGDRAVRTGLDAIESAIKMNEVWDRRHQIAHLALVHPADLPRFSSLGVTANYQALWAQMTRERYGEIEAVGPERAQRLFAVRSMLDTGTRVVFGSDWISASMNPLYSIQVAVTRRPPDGSEPAWLPEQRISLREAIRAYTIEGAWQAGHEQLTGSIEVGKAADLALLQHNLFEVDEMEISKVPFLRTLLNGKTVYRRSSSQR